MGELSRVRIWFSPLVCLFAIGTQTAKAMGTAAARKTIGEQMDKHASSHSDRARAWLGLGTCGFARTPTVGVSDAPSAPVGTASLRLDIGIFCDFLYSVLILQAILGLDFLGLALSRPQVLGGG
jgi:hypothetical protein